MVDRSRLDTKIQTCAHRSCISVHGLFPFNPAALQVRESSCRGEPHFAIERTSQPSDHQPSLPCLALPTQPTQPPTRLYTSIHTRLYIDRLYTQARTTAHPPTAYSGCFSYRASQRPVRFFSSRAGWDPSWKEASSPRCHVPTLSRFYSLCVCVYTSLTSPNTCIYATRINVRLSVRVRVVSFFLFRVHLRIESMYIMEREKRKRKRKREREREREPCTCKVFVIYAARWIR